MTGFEKSAPGEHSPIEKRIGDFLERVIFDHRRTWLAVIAAATVVLGYFAAQVRPETGYQKMIPQHHEYVENFNKHKAYTQSPVAIRIIVEAREGTIFDAAYLEQLQKLNDEVFFLAGVDRAKMRSMWTKNVQWRAVTEDGFLGGVLIDDSYDGSPESLKRLQSNVLNSGEVGKLVANDFKSSIIYVPLLDFDPETGERLNYAALSSKLDDITSRYSSDTMRIRIVGFPKLVGDMIKAIGVVAIFFGITVLSTFFLLYRYSRCAKQSFITVVCALLAIVWQWGILRLLGFGLDPFSILVPFLIFAIGVSHAVQNVNYMALAASTGQDKLAAARSSFRYVLAPGSTALVSNAIGFLTLLFIPIQIIRELAIAATVGVIALMFSKLVLLPILMSFVGISPKGIAAAKSRVDRNSPIGRFLKHFAEPKWAAVAIVFGVVVLAASLYGRHDLKIGDLDKGAPEFRPNSAYNQDVDYMVTHYSSSADTLTVMVTSEQDGCTKYATLDSIRRFSRAMQQVPGVQSVTSTVTGSSHTAAMLNEGNIKWLTLSRDQRALDSTMRDLPENLYYNVDRCDLSLIYLALDDHKAETLSRVTDAAKRFIEEYGVEGVRYELAAGNAGVEAATNEVIAAKQTLMLVLVYAVVTLMVYVTFRNFRSVVCIMVPLLITSMLCEAVMAVMGIGVKVATLPVIALGVGIGVDYGIYIYARLEHYLLEGYDVREGYRLALRTAGRAVIFTGLTLAAGVVTWVFSPLKFQADMGVLLTFMFIWNMIGALTLLPAIATFLFPRSPQPQGLALQTGSGLG